jgi:hypothetical protein
VTLRFPSTRLPPIARLLLSIALVFSLNGCDGFVEVDGIVRNSFGRPVPIATVHVTDSEQYWYANADDKGCFIVAGTTSPWTSNQPLTIYASGYKVAKAEVPNSPRNHVAVTLEPIGSTSQSSAESLKQPTDGCRTY